MMPTPRPNHRPRVNRTRPRSAARRVVIINLIATLCALPAPWASPAAHAQGQALPALGESASSDFSPAAERALGDSVMREIRRDPAYFDDPVLLEHVRTIWTRLVNAARQRGEITPEMDAAFAWEPFLVRDRSVNAFALPGGYIGVNLGLIAITTSDDELASVLGHELSHVTQRHIVRSIGQQQRLSVVSIASMLLGILAASRAPQAAEALIVGGQAASVQGQLNFSRDMEREADRVGFGILTTAGYSRAGMASMFEKLDQASHLTDDNSYPYLRTHPLTTERIGEARARAGLARVSITPDLEHLLLRQRARALMDPRATALQPIIDQAQTGVGALTTTERLGRAYAATLAALTLSDPPLALTLLDTLDTAARALPAAERTALQRQIDWLHAEVLLSAIGTNGPATATTAEASTRLDNTISALKRDTSRPTLLLRARRNLLPSASAAQNKDAASALQTHATREPGDAQAWQLLAQAWRQLNQPLRAVRAEAEASAALGDVAGAIERLRSAQRQLRAIGTTDFVEASVIDARLRAFETEMRRQRENDASR